MLWHGSGFTETKPLQRMTPVRMTQPFETAVVLTVLTAHDEKVKA